VEKSAYYVADGRTAISKGSMLKELDEYWTCAASPMMGVRIYLVGIEESAYSTIVHSAGSDALSKDVKVRRNITKRRVGRAVRNEKNTFVAVQGKGGI
jgi:hypothetical protein